MSFCIFHPEVSFIFFIPKSPRSRYKVISTDIESWWISSITSRLKGTSWQLQSFHYNWRPLNLRQNTLTYGNSSGNFSFRKNQNIIGIYFSFNPKCGIWNCCRLYTASNCEFFHALAGAWFCQLQRVFARVWHLEFWVLLWGYINARTLGKAKAAAAPPAAGCWLQFVTLCQVVLCRDEKKLCILTSKIKLAPRNWCPSSEGGNLKISTPTFSSYLLCIIPTLYLAIWGKMVEWA